MAYGIQVTGPAGNETINLSMLGGRSFVQEINRDWEYPGGQTYQYTFPNIPSGDDVVIYVANAGPFYWETSTVNNQAVLTLHANVPTGTVGAGSSNLTLLVFARRTVESFNNDYGVALVNDNGERIVSAIYPTAEYLGKLEFSPRHDPWVQGGDAFIPFSSYHLYAHTCTATSLGAGRTRIILWNLPDTANDVWYACDISYISKNVTSAYQVQVQVVCKPNKGYTVPEAYVFAVDGISTSSDSYGLRIYDASGNCTFDGGLNHMVINAYQTNMAYQIDDLYYRYANNFSGQTISRPNPTGASNDYTISAFNGINPLIVLPTYTVDEGVPNPDRYVLSSWTYYHTGMVRKSGNVLSLKRITTNVFIEDTALSQGWYWEYGSASSIGTVIVDGTPYSAAPILTADLATTISPSYGNINTSGQLSVSWTCSGANATILSWYLDDVYQSDLPLVGSGLIGPLPFKSYDGYNALPYNVVVVAKTASGKVVSQSSFQFTVYQ